MPICGRAADAGKPILFASRDSAMRVNLPITQQEYELRDGAMLVSTTDTKGRITFANEDFITASGFSETELIGKAHNIVRHPDMPEEAFADLWKTLTAGKPWTALVKNRRKNGDCYWVVANVTPIRTGTEVTGYMSVRSKATRAQITAAEEAETGGEVVASEVRNLASRSALAAKEIKELITDSVQRVERGSSLVGESGKTLGTIVASVKKVSDIVGEIATASAEQSSGIEQVNRAVMQMDQITQQNAALVEQATAASRSMADQALELTRIMEKYRLADTVPVTFQQKSYAA